MAVDFSAFDKKVDQEALQKDINEAQDTYTEIPDGTYVVGIDKMEIKTTKDGKKLMFAVQCNIKEAVEVKDKHGNAKQVSRADQSKYKKRKIFFNRVIFGNNQTETWGDARAIKSVITWLEKLEPATTPEFINYTDFAECVLDIFQEVASVTEMEVDYNAKDFNPISINEVFDI